MDIDINEFKRMMQIIRSHADKIYLLEGDRKPVLIIYSKEQSDHVEKLVKDINDACRDRLDWILLEDYDYISIGEKSDLPINLIGNDAAVKFSTLDL